MDASHFDLLTQSLSTASSRRRLLAALLAGLLTSRRPAATVVADQHHRKRQGQGKSRGTGQGKAKRQAHRRRKTTAQAVPASCFGSGSCLPGPAAYLAKCDFTDANALENVNCTGCNLSDSSLLRADASGANFNKANLSRVCLVDADLTGATINASTNLQGAIFCRTKMPNGSTNNSGCSKSTRCCPTCVEPGKTGCNSGGCCAGSSGCCGNVCCQAGDVCVTTKTPNVCCTPVPKAIACATKCGPGVSDGCGGSYDCGMCAPGATPTCNNGTCATCAATCSASCFACYNLVEGSTRCTNSDTLDCSKPCSSNADCTNPPFPLCIASMTTRSGNQTISVASLCNSPSTATACAGVDVC